jgi:hypothetical protein
MIKKISIVALMASALTLTACSEKPQGVVAAKKGDEKAYVAADNNYVIKGWTSGDQASWEKQMKARSRGDSVKNDNKKITRKRGTFFGRNSGASSKCCTSCSATG